MGRVLESLALGASFLAIPAIAQEGIPTTAPSAQHVCELPGGWNAVAQRNPDFVVFGETHGTKEAPAFIAALTCAVAKGGQRVLVAIEHNASADASLQAAWSRPNEEFGEALLETGWSGREDGVASEAMFDLVTGLHRLKQEGFAISIVAFNGARDEDQRSRWAHIPGQGSHEAAQAENIANAAAQGEYDIVVVLVGSLHAIRQSIELNGTTIDPMARQLSQYGEVIALEMRHAGGTAWNCGLKPGITPQPGVQITDADIECAGHPVSATQRSGARHAIELASWDGRGPLNRDDGWFWVGTISASPPKQD